MHQSDLIWPMCARLLECVDALSLVRWCRRLIYLFFFRKGHGPISGWWSMFRFLIFFVICPVVHGVFVLMRRGVLAHALLLSSLSAWGWFSRKWRIVIFSATVVRLFMTYGLDHENYLLYYFPCTRARCCWCVGVLAHALVSSPCLPVIQVCLSMHHELWSIVVDLLHYLTCPTRARFCWWVDVVVASLRYLFSRSYLVW